MYHIMLMPLFITLIHSIYQFHFSRRAIHQQILSYHKYNLICCHSFILLSLSSIQLQESSKLIKYLLNIAKIIIRLKGGYAFYVVLCCSIQFIFHRHKWGVSVSLLRFFMQTKRLCMIQQILKFVFCQCHYIARREGMDQNQTLAQQHKFFHQANILTLTFLGRT